MVSNQSQRPKFYENQYLGAEDLTAAVEYDRVQHERHALGAHTWGIAAGLQLLEQATPAGGNNVDVYLQPGYAWDGLGRAITVLAPYKIPVEKFASIACNSSNGCLVDVWLRYDEVDTQPPLPGGFQVCDPANQLARTQESFEIEVGFYNGTADQRDPISVAGHSLDAQQVLTLFGSADQLYDTSVPYQTLPQDDPRALWLLPLGQVRWVPGSPGNFVKLDITDKAISERKRRYIGVVAEGIQAAGSRIRLRSRTFDDSSRPWSDDLVWVEGSLRIENNINLFGGNLAFLDQNGNAGQNNQIPLTIQRLEPNEQGGTDLQVMIGQDNQGKNRFAVGHLDASKTPPLPVEQFVVTDEGKVGIGITEPTHPLHVDATAGIRQKRLYLSGGDTVNNGWSSLSYNAYHKNDNSNWIFPDTSHSAVTIEMDDSAGHPRFEVYSTTPGSPKDWSLRLAINGETGDVLLANNGGFVGIGTNSPVRKLHVEGSEIHNGNAGAGFSFGNRETSAFVQTPAAGERWVWYSTQGTARLWSGSDKLAITPSGSVGIGTTTMSRKLHVEGGEVHSGGAGSGFSFGNWETPDFVETPTAGERWVWYATQGTARLWSGSDRLTVSSTGNLTILGNRTYLQGLDGAQTHWIMAGGTQEGINNAIGLTLNPPPFSNTFHTGPGWTKGFLIDHPLYKEEKYLGHATLEGPEAAVFYRGEAELSNGSATIVLPDYFEALTRKEGRTILLTSKLEGNAPVAVVAASEIVDGKFTVKAVAGENQRQKFYWEVKAVRADVGALNVEQAKIPASKALRREI